MTTTETPQVTAQRKAGVPVAGTTVSYVGPEYHRGTVGTVRGYTEDLTKACVEGLEGQLLWWPTAELSVLWLPEVERTVENLQW